MALLVRGKGPVWSGTAEADDWAREGGPDRALGVVVGMWTAMPAPCPCPCPCPCPWEGGGGTVPAVMAGRVRVAVEACGSCSMRDMRRPWELLGGKGGEVEVVV